MDNSKADEGRVLRVAFFHADPLVKSDRLPYNYKQERNKITDVLKESQREIRFRSEPATVQSVRSRLTSGCQILHFAGHGDADSLEFESERHCGKAGKLLNRNLGNLIKAGGIVPDLVFLESYNPEMCGWAVVSAGVPHVVVAASKSDVPDGTTGNFAASFYTKLIAKNFTVQEAFNKAVSDVNTTTSSFLLMPNDNSHEVQILNGLPKGKFNDEAPRQPKYFNLPPVRNACIERVQLRNLLSLLEDKDTNCVTITGESKIDKTAIALQACHYMGERNQFSAIFFVDCRDAMGNSCPFPTSGRPEAHIQHLCRLVGLALHASQDISCPRDLVAYLKWKSGHESGGISEPTHQGNLYRKILLVLDGVNALVEGGGIEAHRSLVDFVGALCCSTSSIKLLLTRKQGLLVFTGRSLSNSTEKVFPLGKNDPEVKNMVTRFSSAHANEVFSQANLMDERGRDIWSRAIKRAVGFGLTKQGHEDDAWYHRHVPWISLSWALNQVMCEMQTTPNSMEMSSSSDQSSRHRFGGSSCARGLEECELDFIRNLLSSQKKTKKDIDGERGSNSLDDRIDTGYGYPGKCEDHEWVSLEVFERFYRGWMGPVIATLSKIQNDWAANDPVKVHGFVSNDKARNQLLKTNQSGVFMFRFSVSDPGRLLLVVTRKATRNASTGDADAPCILYIEQSPVTVSEDGKWIVGKGRSRRTFNSLHKLVDGKRSLGTLYPDIPKGVIFPTTSPTMSSTNSLVTVV